MIVLEPERPHQHQWTPTAEPRRHPSRRNWMTVDVACECGAQGEASWPLPSETL